MGAGAATAVATPSRVRAASPRRTNGAADIRIPVWIWNRRGGMPRAKTGRLALPREQVESWQLGLGVQFHELFLGHDGDRDPRRVRAAAQDHAAQRRDVREVASP